MKSLNQLNIFYYYLIALGLSLSSISVTQAITFYISELTILILLMMSILIVKKININLISLITILLGLIIFSANLVNYYSFDQFSLSGFLFNFLRILGIVLIVLCLPSLIDRFAIKTFIKALLGVLLFHCVLVIIDPFVNYPWKATNDGLVFGSFQDAATVANRGSGLFEEPSFFGIYVGLITALIIQYQHSLKINILRPIHYAIIALALISASSLSAFFILLILTFILLISNWNLIFKKTNKQRITLSVIFFTPILFFLTAAPFLYLSERISLTDGSSVSRLYGSYLFTEQIIQDSPYTGIGLGGKNQDIFLSNLDQDFNIDYVTDVINFSSVTYWANLTAAGGIFSLALFYVLLGYMFFRSESRYLAILIIPISFFGGGVFDSLLWLVIATSISFTIYRDKQAPFKNI